MSNREESRIGRPGGVDLQIQSLKEVLAAADQLDFENASIEGIRGQLETGLKSAVSEHGFFHAVPMQYLICVVDRWIGYRDGIAEPLLEDVMAQVSRVWRRESGDIRFNDNVFNVLLRLSESSARAGRKEDGLQFMALNELLVESWRGPNHADYAGAVFNLGRYLHLVGRVHEAESEFQRALSVEGKGDFSEIRSHVRLALERLKEGSPVHEFSDPEILRPGLCLLESSLLPQRKQAAERVLELCRTNPHLHLRQDHEGVGKAKADSEASVWEPIALARLHLADSPAHHATALVLEAQRFDPDESLRVAAMELLSQIPVSKISGELFERFVLHMSRSLRSTDPDVVVHAARCLDQATGWQALPPVVVETLSELLSGGNPEVREMMMEVLYSAAQYGDSDLSSAVETLHEAHKRHPDLRPRAGRTLCRHFERVSGEPYIQVPAAKQDLPPHWKAELTRLPLYGVEGETVENKDTEVGGCARCGGGAAACLYSRGGEIQVCEFYCPDCSSYTNYRFIPDAGY